MSKPFLGLRTCIYKVGDMNKAKAWYTMAFETAPYFDEPFYVGFNIGGYELGLQPLETPVDDKANGSVTYWGIEDIEAVYAKLLQAGATPCEKIMEVGGGIKVGSVKDEWGNEIGIIYNPIFKVE